MQPATQAWNGVTKLRRVDPMALDGSAALKELEITIFGPGGAAISRTKKGERISNITTKFPHWFSLNFKKYSDREADLPVDQHQLLGLIAPRLLYVASATEDPWADPASEFEACVRVGPVYALFGKNGLATDKAPAPDVALHGGAVGYHLRTGKHDLALSDWVHFMDFADQHGWAAP